MGNKNTGEKKHLVIVGGSFAGLILLHNVWKDFNVTLVEKKDHFEWICMLPKSILDKNGFFENESTVMLKDTIERDRVFGENVSFKQAMLTQVVDQHSIKVKSTVGLEDDSELDNIPEETIKFDYLVIATGSNYIANETRVEDVANIFSINKRKEYLQKYQDEVEKASSILIVGGGPTGCETVGELLIQYGDKKKIGIMQSQSRLLADFSASAGDAALKSFTDAGVNVYLNKRYDPNSEEAREYDFVIKCIGLHHYTPFFDHKEFKAWKDERGRIFVNQYLQLTNVNPQHRFKGLDASKVYDNIFCYGDAWLSLMNEVKNIPSIQSTCGILAYNLKEASKPSPKYKGLPYAVDNVAGLYLGQKSGIMAMNEK